MNSNKMTSQHPHQAGRGERKYFSENKLATVNEKNEDEILMSDFKKSQNSQSNIKLNQIKKIKLKVEENEINRKFRFRKFQS